MEAFQRFEHEWAKWAGVENVVGCSSGTAALHLAIESLKIPQGSRIIVPDYTMIACARAVTLAGMVPIFADVTNEGLLDPLKVEALCYSPSGSRIKAVMPVHLYGRSCDMVSIHDIAGKYDLKVIEDLAEAHCNKPHPNTHASCWSFYKNKVVFGEEGGAVAFRHDLTNETKLALQLRTLGFTSAHNYTHVPRGHNYRLSNLHASEILANLTNVDTWVHARRVQERIYDLARPSCITTLTSPRETPWVYDIVVPGMTLGQQKKIIDRLWYYNIPVRYGFYPMTLQEEYSGFNTDRVVGEWNSDRLMREVIYFPLGQSLGCDVRYAARAGFQVIQDVMSSPS